MRVACRLATVIGISIGVLTLASCAIRVAGSWGGDVCFGLLCERSSIPPTPPDAINLVLSHHTRFDRSIKPSIDNFVSRYRANPDDAELRRWLQEFLEPASAMLSSAFGTRFTLEFDLVPDKPEMLVSARRMTWTEAPNGSAAYQTLKPLIKDSTAAAIRWSLTVHSAIYPHSDRQVNYRTQLSIAIEQQPQIGAAWQKSELSSFNAVSDFRDRFSVSLLETYKQFLQRNYGLSFVSP